VKLRTLLFALLLAPLLAQAEPPSAAALFAATLTDLSGQAAAMEPFRGRPLVVNFWARWCGPCRTEIPMLIKLREKYRKRGLEVLGIAIEDNTESVRDFAKAYDMDYPILLAKDQGLALMQALGNSKQGLPFSVAIDARGKLVLIKMGSISSAELNAAAEAALK
jgi:thiol-disulfide isomerase/thioredoxin